MKCSSLILCFFCSCVNSALENPKHYTYDESKAAFLIEDIDGFRVSRGISFEASGDHGHVGLEYKNQNEIPRSTTEWVVQISGGEPAASVIVADMGYEIVGKVFEDFYVLKKSQGARLQRSEPPVMVRSLASNTRVLWAEQQFGKKRQKRGYLPNSRFEESDQPLIREKRVADRLDNRIGVTMDAELRITHQLSYRFSDPLWDHQWYLHDTRTLPSLPRIDLNVDPVYNMGFTGRGVTVVVLDDGIEYNHTDLALNYDPEVSFDINNDDPDPSPRYGSGMLNSHGTRCAGEIAMVANNDKCGVGVAFKARIGGIRMLDGTVTDRIEAASLTYALHKVDIYSASWGPRDDGRTVEGPGKLARQALLRGVTEGRNGSGAIYIWAAGNGGRQGDNCNVDGYVSSIYTLSIGSVTEQGKFPWYGEECASNMAVTYSSGAYYDQKIATTDLNNQCTMDHTGTSAAAPLAAGIVALALEANPVLTWRDVKHITAWTADPLPLENNFGWHENAAGFRCNTRFGFGLMNGAKFVEAAINWKTVPDKKICVIGSSNLDSSVVLTNEQSAQVYFLTDGCQGSNSEVNYLEHVELVITLQYPSRGLLEMYLTSPSGTRTQILKPRVKDTSSMGFINWPFMSVHTWGENPKGQWLLTVTDKVSEKGAVFMGQVVNATLILHGTSVIPEYRKNGSKSYNSFSSYSETEVSDGLRKLPVDINDLRSKNPELTWNDLIGLKLSR